MYFYVANLGSEVQRVLGWQERGDREAARNAYKRAISIIDKIKSFDNKNANIEMDILSQLLKELISDDKQSFLNREQIFSYFNPFAMRVLRDAQVVLY